MRTKLLVLATAAAAALAAFPAAAAAEVCFGADGVTKRGRDSARADIRVVPGRSIGPIAIGMTRTAIRRATGADGRRIRGTRTWTFRTSGIAVRVTFGRWGRAHGISAASNRLTIGDVRLGAGADAVAAKLPGFDRAHCEVDTELWNEGPERTRIAVADDPRARQGTVSIVSEGRVPLD